MLTTLLRKTGLITQRIRLSLVRTDPLIRTCAMEKGQDIWYIEYMEPVEDRVTYVSCKGIREV